MRSGPGAGTPSPLRRQGVAAVAARRVRATVGAVVAATVIAAGIAIAAAAGGADLAPQTPAPAADTEAQPPSTPELFLGYCQSCHMPDGEGIAGLYPPVSHTWRYALFPEGRAYLARVVLHGLVGPIAVNGARYTGYMPAFREILDDDTLADLLNEIVRYFASRSSQPPAYVPYTPEEVAQHRSRLMTTNAVHEEREGVVREMRRLGLPVP